MKNTLELIEFCLSEECTNDIEKLYLIKELMKEFKEKNK